MGVVRRISAPKLNPEAIGFDTGVVVAASAFPLASPLFSGEPVLPKPKPNEADEVLGFGAKLNPVMPFDGGRSELEPMLKENVGNLLGVVDAEAEGVDGALKRKEDAPVLDGDGTTMLSAIAGFTVGLMAKMLDCF